jgi:hypothetical protein
MTGREAMRTGQIPVVTDEMLAAARAAQRPQSLGDYAANYSRNNGNTSYHT